MKKNNLKVLAAAALVSSIFTVQSCTINLGDDDNNNTGTSTTNIASTPSNFQGTIISGEAVTLDSSKTYTLTGPVKVEDGGTLIIPAGTRIESNAGTDGYVLIKQGGKIFCDGTSSNPVVFTSANTTPAPQDWGGLVICGKATNNKGTGLTSEVGNSSYGGTEDGDNSGSITYTRIEYSGANFSESKEYNGISFFAVGSGTTVHHIQIYNGNDDGVEFFGGTVEANFIMVNGAGDDSFDWTEGWTGGGNYWYSTKITDVGDRGIEADNLKADNYATPTSNPTISNVTLIGNGSSDGIKFRRGTKGMLSNVVLSNWEEGIDVDDDATIANVADGSLKVTNIQFESSVVTNNDTDATGVYTEADNSGAGNGIAVPTWAEGWTTGL